MYVNLHIKSYKLMGILWAHTGAIGCIVLNPQIHVRSYNSKMTYSAKSLPHEQYYMYMRCTHAGAYEPSKAVKEHPTV